MKSSFKLQKDEIKKNIEQLKIFLKEKKLDGFYISSSDAYLSEYTPLEECHRYYFTGFTGSTAEVLLLPKGKVKLYVDGRYFEQADNEVDLSEIEVVKCLNSPSAQLLEDIKTLKFKNVGAESERTSKNYAKSMGDICTLHLFSTTDLEKYVAFKRFVSKLPVEFIAKKFRGSDTKDKCKRVLDHSKHAYFVSAIDSVSWITNCRGYHLPYLSSFVGKALITKDKVYVFVDPETVISDEAAKQKEIEFIKIPETQFEKKLQELQKECKLQVVMIDSAQLNASDYAICEKVFGPSTLQEVKGALYNFQSIKEPEELQEMINSFERSNKAVFNSIQWVKESVKAGKKISEYDVFENTNEEYKKTGAKGQSFNTISGVGANSSIIHFSSPSKDTIVKKENFLLLDSGGYYDGGFATDTTRTFLVDSSIKPDPKFVEMYTLTLKGLLTLQNSLFPDKVAGSVIDGFARYAMYQKGFNYNHGTGHGVGIHVHEPGVRISPVSSVPMQAGQVVSLEPGIYLPGFGGVRLENIAIVEKAPKHPGFLRFKNLVWIGFEEKLIDYSLLNEDEKRWLQEYHAECAKKGNLFS